MGGAEAILDRAQQAMAGKAIALKREHGVHQVFKHLGPGQHPFLGDMPHQHQSRRLAFGEALKGCGTFADLAHRAGSTGEITVMESLNAVDDRHIGTQGLQLLKHHIQIGFRQELQIVGTGMEPLPSQLHLLG